MKPTFKGTPGPWAVMHHTSTGIESSENRFVATTGSYSDGTEETHLENEANAKLISAAPELLEALQYARRFLRDSQVDVAYIDSTITKALGTDAVTNEEGVR